MSFEQTINQQLNRYPGLKRGIKRAYQRTMYALSPKIKAEGDIQRLSPADGAEYFFGYYDKSPWDASGRYVLCMKARDTWSSVAPSEAAQLLLIDTGAGNACRVLAQTHCWNVQQGCMMQWLGPGFDRQIIYNDFRNGSFCAVILDVFTGQERQLPRPVYSVSADGKTALTLDFSRLHRLRPGYGYSNLPDATAAEKLPQGPCIWKMELETGTVAPLLTYQALRSFQPRPEMEGAEHKVNHIMLSPGGQRFMFLHRWFREGRKYSRLLTCDIDGTDLYALSDDDMVSHCCWKNDAEILAFENKKGAGAGYYLMQDKTQAYRHLWPHMNADGHPSYSPDGRLVVTDTYPDRARVASIKVMDGEAVNVVARVFAPFRYDNDTRCDLHPRWSRDGKSICFDAVFEGHRGLYKVAVERKSDVPSPAGEPASTARKKIVYLLTSCKRTGPAQQTLNIIRHLNREKFQPILVTLYAEEADNYFKQYLDAVEAHYYVPTGKKAILLGTDKPLQEKLAQIAPDVIHTVGVFPGFAVSRRKKYKQVMTLRNYVYEDYPAKFGPARGHMLARMDLYSMAHAAKVVTCSESLSRIYREKLGRQYDFIRNGVDLDGYCPATRAEKAALRKQLHLPADACLFAYSGQFIKRKNLPFLLENFAGTFGGDAKAGLVLLGDGPEYEELSKQYKGQPNIFFMGRVSNVGMYLKACDTYVSTSKSEGLPNGVLEAMATGLPVVLSDIEQHKEVFSPAAQIGYLYKKDDARDFCDKIKVLYSSNVEELGQNAYKSACENFSAAKMSRQYQKIYKTL